MPLNDPLPSTAADVIEFNVQKIDEEVNSTSDTYTDRFGVERLTNVGRTNVNQQLIAAAVEQTGFFPVDGSFEAGGTITSYNQVLNLQAAVGDDAAGFYSWGGALPKVVTAASTPTTSGGTGVSAWVYRGEGVNSVRNVSDVKALANVPRIDGAQYGVKGFYAGSDVGGGLFYWDAGRDKADHNGSTIIAPEAIASWDGTQGGLATLIDWAGTGAGVFVRKVSNREPFEIFGAVGGGVIDNTVAWRSFIKSDITNISIGSSTFYIDGQMDEKDHMSILGDGSGSAKIISGLANQLIFSNPSNTRRYGISLKGFTFQGDSIQGNTDGANIARAVGVIGWQDFYFEDVIFDTFNLTGCQVSRLQGGWIDSGDYNSPASVENLISLNSRNGVFYNCGYKNIVSSSGKSIFGGSSIRVDSCEFNNTGLVNILVDDASQSTPLEDYSVNDDIHIIDCNGDGLARLDGCASGSMIGNRFVGCRVRSYDFDQQKNNIPLSPNYTGKPFLFLNYLDRKIEIIGNLTNEIEIRSAPSFVKARHNTLISSGDSSNLLVLGNNGVSWPSEITYWDSVTETTTDNSILDAKNNTYICRHLSVKGVYYSTLNPIFSADLRGSLFITESGAFQQEVNEPAPNGYSYTLGDAEVSAEDKVLKGPLRSLSVVDAQYTRIQLLDIDAFSTGVFHNYDAKNAQTQKSTQYSFGLTFNGGAAETRFAVSDAVGVAPSEKFAFGRTYLCPLADNVYSAGTASNRFSELYAGNGVINTSDERFKSEMVEISDAETAAAKEIKSNIFKFKMLDAIEKKGEDNARWHFGVGAQTVFNILKKHGLDPFSYSFLCYDEWDDFVEVTPEVIKDGVVVEPEKSTITKAGGNIFGIRYDQLSMFILSAI